LSNYQIMTRLGVAFAVAAALAGCKPPPQQPTAQASTDRAPAKPEQDGVPMVGRTPISAAQSSAALASGSLDHPIKSLLSVKSPMHYGEWIWNDRGVPAGPTWIRVDLHSQLLSVFRSGHEIGTAVVLYGADGLPTPTGKFPILAKLKDHVSATYGNAPMPYTLRLTNDGVAIHGSNVRWGFATHGCVGIPKEFAAKLFEVVAKGDEVLIVKGEARPAAAG
jgi:lipoprotein-anchoring transpeptidase ErfK/SrfK